VIFYFSIMSFHLPNWYEGLQSTPGYVTYSEFEISNLLLNRSYIENTRSSVFPYLICIEFYTSAGNRCVYVHCSTEDRFIELLNKLFKNITNLSCDITHLNNKCMIKYSLYTFSTFNDKSTNLLLNYVRTRTRRFDTESLSDLKVGTNRDVTRKPRWKIVLDWSKSKNMVITVKNTMELLDCNRKLALRVLDELKSRRLIKTVGVSGDRYIPV